MAVEDDISEQAKERRLQLVVRISLTLSVLFYALWLATQPNFISDIFWQIRLGDEIRIRHAVPMFDEFSWSCPRRPIVLHEWGTCLVFAECYPHLGGWIGIFGLEIAVACTVLLWLFRMILKSIPNSPFI